MGSSGGIIWVALTLHLWQVLRSELAGVVAVRVLVGWRGVGWLGETERDMYGKLDKQKNVCLYVSVGGRIAKERFQIYLKVHAWCLEGGLSVP